MYVDTVHIYACMQIDFYSGRVNFNFRLKYDGGCVHVHGSRG